MLLILGVVGSVIAALMLTATTATLATSRAGGGQPLETVWGPASATNRLRVVEVNGPIMGSPGDGVTLIGGTYGYEIADMIDDLDKDDVDGLILELNTPGGTIYGSRAIADAVTRYQERTDKKVVAYVRGLSASGGVYAMAGADEILADRGTFIGSIGVITGPFDRYRDVTGLTGSLLEPGVQTNGGVDRSFLTKGKGKDFGNPYRDMTEEEKAVFTETLDNEYDEFVNWVSTARDIPAATIKNELGAYIFGTEMAKDNGLIDAAMGREDAYARAAEVNGLTASATKVQKAKTPGVFEQLLGAEAHIHGAAAPAQGTDAQAPRATSVVCTGAPIVLAYHGDPSHACG